MVKAIVGRGIAFGTIAEIVTHGFGIQEEQSTIEEKVQTILAANAGLVGLLPAARIRVSGSWQNLTVPYIVHGPQGVQELRTNEGLPRQNMWDPYKIDIVSSSYSSGRNVSEAVITALSGVHNSVHGFWQTLRHFREDETNVEHFIVEFLLAE
ncbi:MAG: hypothetical protein A2Z18_02580 [Armatimonadetes bacterium RBG_16_58_9]|nr:MAG: hypothetical protein A2Z18_02580 [Armatimonadetes bacterium RBG_16_58_9]